MKFCYADPPYFGLAQQFYGHLHPEAAAYDKLETHAALINRLSDEYPDGWAMSLQSPALKHILPLCPTDCRVMAWVKPFASFKPGVGVAYAWEPVIIRGGAPPRPHATDDARLVRRQHHAEEGILRREAARLRPLDDVGPQRGTRGPVR
jgi:hypothetical protein